MAGEETAPALAPKTTLPLVNKVAYAHMLPFGGKLTLTLLDQEALRTFVAGKDVCGLVIFDPMLAMLSGMDPDQFGAWFLQATSGTLGRDVAASEEPVHFTAGTTALLAEMEAIPSPIDIPGQARVRVVTHWYRVDVAERFDRPAKSGLVIPK